MSDAKVRSTYNDIPVYEYDELAWTTPPPLSEARVAVVTTAGLRTDGVTMWSNQDQSFTVISHGEKRVTMSHRSQNFDRSGFNADMNVVVPMDRLDEMAADGTIGSVASRHISFMGAQGDATLAAMRMDSGPAAAQILKDDGVDVVLLTPV
jgi:D-proline reductase (dithiol) PrdB